MRALLIATGECPAMLPLTERQPVELTPLADRPFLQHVVEALTAQGVKQFDVVLCHCPEKSEALLGDGKRWGASITYHLARDPQRPYRVLKTLTFSDGESLLLAHADCLPQADLATTQPDKETRPAPVLFTRQEPPAWSGWAWISPEVLNNVPADADRAVLEACLRSAARPEAVVCVPKLLTMQSFEDCLAANKAFVEKEFSGLLCSAREIEPGIWISRNVSLHPTAKVTPPVYVSEDCQIGFGVQLGPRAIVGQGCWLDARCSVVDSVVLPGSYVGETLELDHAIVDKNRLINVRVGTAVTITDDFILGSLHETQLRTALMCILAQGFGIICLLLAAPVLAMIALALKAARSGPVLRTRQVVALPADGEERTWRTFDLWNFAADRPTPASWLDLLWRVLPALVNIARGQLHFVGVPPRSREEIQALPPDWRKLYLRAKAGVITEADVYFGPNPTEDERYMAEAYYAANAGFRHDWRLMLRYARLVVFGRSRLYVEEVGDETT